MAGGTRKDDDVVEGQGGQVGGQLHGHVPLGGEAPAAKIALGSNIMSAGVPLCSVSSLGISNGRRARAACLSGRCMNAADTAASTSEAALGSPRVSSELGFRVQPQTEARRQAQP